MRNSETDIQKLVTKLQQLKYNHGIVFDGVTVDTSIADIRKLLGPQASWAA
jgi:hypothetical protein